MNSNIMRSVWGLPPKLPRKTGWPKAVLRDIILFEYKSLKPTETNVNMRIAVDYGCRDELLHWGDCDGFKLTKDQETITLKPTRNPKFGQFVKRNEVYQRPVTPKPSRKQPEPIQIPKKKKQGFPMMGGGVLVGTK